MVDLTVATKDGHLISVRIGDLPRWHISDDKDDPRQLYFCRACVFKCSSWSLATYSWTSLEQHLSKHTDEELKHALRIFFIISTEEREKLASAEFFPLPF
jgi:hypothetical protein